MVDAPEEGRLPGTRGPAEHEHLARRDLELDALHLDLPLLDAGEGMRRVGVRRQHVLLHDLVAGERAEQAHAAAERAAVVLEARLHLVAGRRLERHALEGRAARRLERCRGLDVGREAVVEEVGRADAVGELLVVLARADRGVPLHPVVARVQRDDEAPELHLVLEVRADLLALLVDRGEERNVRDGRRVVNRLEEVDRRRRAEPEAELRESVVVAVVHAEEQVLLHAAAPEVHVQARVGG